MFTQHRANFRWARKFALTLGSHADCSIFSRCVFTWDVFWSAGTTSEVYTFVRLRWLRVKGTTKRMNFQPVENSSDAFGT